MSYVQPFLDLSHSTSLSMYACILDISGPIPAGQKEVAIGMSKVLALSVLSFGLHTIAMTYLIEKGTACPFHG